MAGPAKKINHTVSVTGSDALLLFPRVKYKIAVGSMLRKELEWTTLTNNLSLRLSSSDAITHIYDLEILAAGEDKC